MPTIELSKKELDRFIGESMTIEKLEEYLPLAKAELKDFDAASGEIKIELNDTNRPDLWSLEGLARQIKIHMTGQMPTYDFFSASTEDRVIIVDAALEKVRPYIGAFAAIGEPISEPMLLQLIQTQEKLAENFGRKRATLSIGIYELSQVTFPVHYTAVDPDSTTFVPLGFNEALSLRRILDEHPKGKDYRQILDGFDRFPFLLDDSGGVLSFPPIINSRRSGEIKTGEHRLFVEATGTDLEAVILGLNIFACNLADAGFSILPVRTEYPYETPRGKQVTLPFHLSRSTELTVDAVNHALGSSFALDEMVRRLTNYGVSVVVNGERLQVTLPPYRTDYLHPVDVIEDFAMSIGYGAFEPLMPEEFTVGRLSKIEEFSDKTRNLMVGYGFEEIISNILISRQELTEMMQQPDLPIIEVSNPMSLQHASLRNDVLPSLLRVEAASAKSGYPHRIFEVGEVVIPDGEELLGSRTDILIGAMIAHPSANFSEIDSTMTILMYHLGLPFAKLPADLAGFIAGRAGKILVRDEPIGSIGEVSPDVLDRWHISVPVSAFVLNLSKLLVLR